MHVTHSVGTASPPAKSDSLPSIASDVILRSSVSGIVRQVSIKPQLSTRGWLLGLAGTASLGFIAGETLVQVCGIVVRVHPPSQATRRFFSHGFRGRVIFSLLYHEAILAILAIGSLFAYYQPFSLSVDYEYHNRPY